MSEFESSSAWAVVVGTGDHDPAGQLAPVPQATATAREIGACLTDVCGLDPSHLEVVLDPKDPADLQRLIKDRSKNADGLFLLYYVGHGILDEENDLHLAIPRTKSRQPGPGESLPYKSVASALADRVYGRGRRTVIILDCCYSGAVLRGNSTLVQAAFGQVNIAGAYEACASAAEAQAWYSESAEFTTFSGALSDLLRHGDERLPPDLRLNDVAGILEERMRLADAPIPRFRDQDLIGSRIILAPNSAYRPPAPPAVVPEPGARIPEDTSPYKDLQAYETGDHQVFFGRRRFVEKFLRDMEGRVRPGGVHLIAGPSGSGKSSVLQAGVLYQIGRANLNVEGSARWPQIVLKPDTEPLLMLAKWLASAQGEGNSDVSELRDRILSDPDSFGAQIARLPPVVPRQEGCRAVIAVDQLEQVFAPDIEKGECAAFLRALQSAATSRAGGFPPALVIATLRSDFLGAYQENRRPEGQGAETVHLVDPMSPEELREVIEGPAHMAGLAFDRGLVDALLRDVEEHASVGQPPIRARSVLPHLSHALQGTWGQRKQCVEPSGNGPGRVYYALTLDGYQRTGGIARALSSTADQTLSNLPAQSHSAAAKIFVSMVRRVRMGDSTVEIGQPARRAELGSLAEADTVAQVLDAFIARRLLTAYENEIAFAHEAVITSWDTLRTWITADGEWLDARRELDDAADEWSSKAGVSKNKSPRNPKAARDLLLPDSRLEDLLSRISRSGHSPTELKEESQAYVAASQSAHARRLRIRRGYVSALAILAVISIAAALVASVNAQNTQTARTQADSRAAAADAAQQRSIDPNIAAQLAAAAYRISPTVEARSALLSTASLTPVTRLADHVSQKQGGTLTIAATRDSRTLATAGADGTVNLWSISNPGHPRRLAHFAVTPASVSEPVVSAAFSPDGTILATGDGDGQLRLWDVRNLRTPRSLGLAHVDPGGAVDTLAFRSGAVLATGSRDGSVQLWNVSDPAKPAMLGKPIGGFAGPLMWLTFSPDGRTLAACDSGDTTVDLFNTTNPARAEPGARLGSHAGSVTALAFSHDGRTLASAAEDNAVRLWRITRPGAASPEGQPLTGHTDAIYTIAFSPDDTRLASGGNDDTVRVWDLSQSRAVAVLTHPQPVQGVLFAQSGSVVITDGNDGLLRSWRLADRQLIGPSGQVASVVYSPRGDALAEGDSDGRLWMWNVVHPDRPVLYGPPEGVCLGQRSGIQRMAFSPQGDVLAVPCNGGHIMLLNVSDPRHPVSAGPALNAGPGDVSAVAFADEGRVLASGSTGGTARLWSVADPRHARKVGPLLAKGNGAIFDVAVSSSGTVLAVGGGSDTVQLWDVSQPASPRKLGLPLGGHSEPVLGLAFQPHGNVLAVSGEDGTVQLWDVADDRHAVDNTSSLVNAGGAVTDVAFGPRGLLAMTNADGTVWLWQVNSSRRATLIAQLTGHRQAAFFADFSPDGRTLASASIDSTAFLWNTEPGQAEAAVCASVGETLTKAERARFLPDDTRQLICS